MNAAQQILEHALARPPRLGTSRLICVDGPSGSGKSTLATEIGSLAGADVLHTDDLCPGWDGIPELPGILASLVRPLATGQPGRYPRYDWILGHQVEDVVLEPAPVVVIEGVGAGAGTLSDLTSTLVWVDADPELRRLRALERDGAYFREHWASWARAEDAYFAAEQVRERASAAVWTS